MAITLTVGKPSYSMYSLEEDKYVYFSGLEYKFSTWPRASGLQKTQELIEAKKEKLLATLLEWSTADRQVDPWFDRWECGQPGPLANISKAELEKIRAHNLEEEKKMWAGKLEIAKKFVYVRIGADLVEETL